MSLSWFVVTIVNVPKVLSSSKTIFCIDPTKMTGFFFGGIVYFIEHFYNSVHMYYGRSHVFGRAGGVTELVHFVKS